MNAIMFTCSGRGMCFYWCWKWLFLFLLEMVKSFFVRAYSERLKANAGAIDFGIIGPLFDYL